MANINYVISGIWLSDGHISYVMLHKLTNDKDIGKGEKKSRSHVADLIKNYVVFTIVWNYSTKGWDLGAEVSVEKNGDIRTHPNNTTTDNLDNLINLTIFPL